MKMLPLVVFGLPVGGAGPPDHGATAALACARGMLGRLAEHNQERAARGLLPLQMGIGIHTGPVVAGNIGVPGRRMEFTCIGDAVNTAARLEGLTKETGAPVLVSAETASRLGPSERLRELAPLSVKGKSEPLRLYALEP